VFSGKGGAEQLTLATSRGPHRHAGCRVADRLHHAERPNIVVSTVGTGTILPGTACPVTGQSLGYSADGAALYTPSGTGSSPAPATASSWSAPRPDQDAPVPRTSANTCGPVRWWNSGTILASLLKPGTGVPRLWLVPVGGAPEGAAPPRIRPQRRHGRPRRLAAVQRLYLQAAGRAACCIFRGPAAAHQAGHGAAHQRRQPGADRARLPAADQAPADCTGSVSLLWYDPGKRAERWLIRAPGNVIGIASAVPFYSRENGNLAPHR
jgi:hypothetical protein